MNDWTGRDWLRVAAVVLISVCAPAQVIAEEPSAAAISELAGSGRLQLMGDATIGFVEFLQDGRPGIFVATPSGGAYAYQHCGIGDCSIGQAERIIEDCIHKYRVPSSDCAIVVFGREIVWRGEVSSPFGRLRILEEHNRTLVQAIVLEFASGEEPAAATVFIDRTYPVGEFTIRQERFGGYCLGTYDFTAATDRSWDLKCLSGYDASGTFPTGDLASGGTGIGTDSEGGEVRLTLMPRG